MQNKARVIPNGAKRNEESLSALRKDYKNSFAVNDEPGPSLRPG
jgi:hypothetical protein